MTKENQDFNSDILQVLPVEKYEYILDLLKQEWPLYCHIYYWVQNNTRWKTKDPSIKFEIYCPGGNPECRVFIGITTYTFYEVMVFAEKRSEHILRECILKTKCLPWKKRFVFIGLHELFQPMIETLLKEFKQTHGIKITEVVESDCYLKSAEDCIAHVINVPEECYLHEVQESDIPLIHNLWPHRDNDNPELTQLLLTKMVQLNKGIGLYSRENGALLSWSLHNNYDGLGLTQTVEEHKRKGYAQVVVKALSKELGLEGKSVSLFIVKQNIPSAQLFSKLGWKRVYSSAWIWVKPNLP